MPFEIRRGSNLTKTNLNTKVNLIIQVALIISLIVYIYIGAYIFRLLEYDNENSNCYEVLHYDKLNRRALTLQLLNLFESNQSKNDSYLRQEISGLIRVYARKVNKYKTNYFHNCSNYSNWNFENAFLYAITVVTTIGYGHVAPETEKGKLVFLCYSMIGLPLFILCLSNLSSNLGGLFRFLYRKLVKLLKKDEKTNRFDDVPLTLTILIITFYISIGGIFFCQLEDWTFIESAYFCFITLSTIGFGDKVPGQNFNKANRSLNLIIGSIYILLGLGVIAMCFDLVQEELIASFTWLGKKTGLIKNKEKNIKKKSAKITKRILKNHNRINTDNYITRKNLEKKIKYYTKTIY